MAVTVTVESHAALELTLIVPFEICAFVMLYDCAVNVASTVTFSAGIVKVLVFPLPLKYTVPPLAFDTLIVPNLYPFEGLIVSVTVEL